MTTHQTINGFSKQENMKLHNHFAIVPVDKAPKNDGIICKSFYLQVLDNEIMKSGNFILSDFTVHGIVSNYSSILKEKHLTIPLNILTYLLYVGFLNSTSILLTSDLLHQVNGWCGVGGGGGGGYLN